MSRFRSLGPCGPFVLALAFVAPAALPQVAIRIVSMPERIQMPIADGRNELVTVEVSGAPVRVWAATDASSSSRVELEAAGSQTWQLNLASIDVQDLLVGAASDAPSPSFRIFASDRSGSIARSVALRYASDRSLRPSVGLELVDADGSTAEQVRGRDGERTWVTPSGIDRIVVRRHRGGDPMPSARIGDREFAFAALDDDESTVGLGIAPDLRANWVRIGSMRVSIEPGRTPIFLLARPERLSIDGETTSMTIKQRERAFVPGTSDYVRVELDDITFGQVLLTVRDAEGRTLVPRRSVREGDVVDFAVGSERAFVTVDKLVNVLIGDDFAQLSVARARSSAARVSDLLDWIRTSDLQFIRNAEPHDGSEAANHLRAKYAALGARVLTADEFIDQIASQSSASGQPYRVVLADGSVVPLREWLRDQVDRHEHQSAQRR